MAVRFPAGFVIEAMRPADVDAVLKVQGEAYAGIDVLEDAGLFLNRIQLSPDTCWVARGPEGVRGYLVSYPWPLPGPPPELNVPLPALLPNARGWFLHDCAVSPAAAGQGVGAALVRTGLAHARRAGLACAMLVSLAPALGYWKRMGFETVQAEPGSLEGYGPGACLMRRAL